MPDPLYGVVTVYLALAHATTGAPGHAGNPLACGGVYAPDNAPWVATDPAFADCGDVVGIWAGGVYRQFEARDTGSLSRYCVEWGGDCLRIGADVPEYWWWADGISDRAIVTNETRARVGFEREAGR
mgnify:CR=1 FL=1